MKKLLLCGAAMLMAISASAQLYVCGDKVNGSMNWNSGAPVEVALENGTYTFKAEGGFKMSTAKGTWDEFNGAAKAVFDWTYIGETMALGQLSTNEANSNPAKSGIEVTYKVNPEFTQIQATFAAGAVDHQVYLQGNMSNWGAINDYKFTSTDGTNYTLSLASLGAYEFKVVVDNMWYGDAISINLDEDYTLYTGGAGNMTLADPNATDLTFNYNVDTKAFKVTGTAGGGDTPVDPTKFYGLHGQIFGGGDWNTKAFTNEDGTWTMTTALVPGEFGIMVCSDAACTAQTSWIGGAATIDAAGTYTMSAGANSSSTLEGTYTITWNPATSEMTFAEAQNVDLYKDLYLVGDLPGWSLNEAYKFTRNENVYTLTLPEAMTAEDNKWKIWDGSWDYNFGCGAAQPQPGVASEVWFDGGNFTQKLHKGTVLEFTLVEGSDMAHSSIPSTLLITGPTGVETIAAEEGEAVYYNMQGARVANPANGIYVRVLNGNATKVVK